MEFVLCDLDGVVWLAHDPIAGAADAVARLRASGRRVLFVTNNSMSTIAEQETALAGCDIPAAGDIVTSAQAGAALIDAGQRVLVAAADGVVEAVHERGATIVDDEHPDVVIVGLHHHFDYAGLRAASRALHNGARFIATNDDATFPTPDGRTPGAGSIVAAVATAGGVAPVIAGKPYEPMAALVRERCGPRFSSATALMVGDRWSTDGEFAVALGCPFALVRTGVTAPGESIGGSPDVDVADLAAVADLVLGRA